MHKPLLTQATLSMLIVVVVITSAAIETDVFVPSFPAIQAYFDISESLTQMILSVNFLGLCFAALCYGPLSDAYGRRSILLIGMGIFLVASIGCVLSDSIYSLLFWRFMQGIGSSAAFVVPGAIIFDIFSKEKAAYVLGLYNSIITTVMAAAPIIGAYLHITHGWRANFVFVALCSLAAFLMVVFLFKESLSTDKRVPVDTINIMKNFVRLFLNRQAFLAMLIISLAISSYLVYIANLSLLFVNFFGVDELYYALYQGTVLAVFAGVSITSAFWMRRLGLHRTKFWGMLMSFLGATGLLLIAFLQPQSALLITVMMCVYTSGFALMINISYSDFMSVYPEIKGIASSLITAVRLIITAISIAVVSLFFNGTMMPVALFIFGASVLSMLAYALEVLD